MTKDQIEIRLKKVKWIIAVSILLIISAILIPFFSYFGVFKPIEESGAVFFQKSGSLVVIICLVLDAFLVWGHSILSPSFDKFFNLAKAKCLLGLRALIAVATILTIGAAVLSGFGEFFWRV
ncbi:hypothetical protein LG325_13755 [Marinobacter nauticus]